MPAAYSRLVSPGGMIRRADRGPQLRNISGPKTVLVPGCLGSSLANPSPGSFGRSQRCSLGSNIVFHARPTQSCHVANFLLVGLLIVHLCIALAWFLPCTIAQSAAFCDLEEDSLGGMQFLAVASRTTDISLVLHEPTSPPNRPQPWRAE